MHHLSRSRHSLTSCARNAALATAVAFALTLLLSPPASAETRIGLAAPLTGRLAATGLAMRSALEAAIAEANAAGGMHGNPLTLIVADDGCASASAEGAAATLIADGAALVIGHPCSGAAVKAAPLYRKAGVLSIAVGARHPDVTAGNTADPVVLRLAGRDDRQGEAAARWLTAHAPGRRIAIVHDRTAYARAIAASAEATLVAAGIETVTVLSIVASNRDYGETIAEIRAKRAEAVLFAGFADEAAIIATGLAAHGPAVALLGTDTLATPGFAEIARRSGIPVQVLLPAEPHPRNNGQGDLASEADGQGQRAAAPLARAAFEAWLATVRRIGSTDATATSRALREVSVNTPTLGGLRFDGNGDLVSEAFVPASADGDKWVRER